MAQILGFPKNPVIPKGTTITCPACAETLHVFTRNIKKGRGLNSLWIDPRPQPKTPMVCPHCHVEYGLVNSEGDVKIHTTQGWILATA